MVTIATSSSMVRVLVKTKNIVPKRNYKVSKSARLKASFGFFCTFIMLYLDQIRKKIRNCHKSNY